MVKYHLFMVLVFYGICSLSVPLLAVEPAPATAVIVADPNAVDKQLKLNVSALFEGASEQMRTAAASVLLSDNGTRARAILIETLGQSENPMARSAVCKALIQTRGTLEPVKNSEDFVDPLFLILKSANESEAKLAAEALLIFDYHRVADRLWDLINNPENPIGYRLNAIEALRLQPEMGAIIQLIELLNNSEPAIADAAEKALKPMGIEFVTKDQVTRNQIIKDIKRNGPDKFLRSWLVRQENDIRDLREQLDYWRNLYVGSLDRVYNGISSEQEKGSFLIEQLNSVKPVIRLWGLNEVEELRVGTGNLPEQIGPIVINMVSDSDSRVRLKAAGILSLMGQLNSSEKLLAQYEVENEAEVRDALFIALGEACYNAFLPSSKLNIAPEVRSRTLEIAGEYLNSADTQRSQNGAEVIKKLLEQNGYEAGVAEKYFGLLGERYNQAGEEESSQLKSEILSVMGRICSASVYKEQAKGLFGAFFEKSLNDADDSVREAGVEGLINVDKVSALVKCLGRGMANDRSEVIRDRLVELAGEVGVKRDVGWLTEKLGSEQQGEGAWKSLVSIFEREGDVDFLVQWWDGFGKSDANFSDERKITYLVMVDGKAKRGEKRAVVKRISGELADLYIKVGDLDRAAEYLGALGELSDGAKEKEAIRGRLLNVYLQRSGFEAAKELVEHSLLGGDLGGNSFVVREIDDYLDSHKADGMGAKLVELLLGIHTAEPRPMWNAQVKRWLGTNGAEKEKAKPAAGSASAADPNKADAK